MSNETTPSRRAGLRDQIANALEAADYRRDMQRGDLADAVLPVLYQEWPWLRAEAERSEAAETRLRLAHQARRAKEHQLDGIRRALCDAGFMEEDDPYGHADLDEVVRQAGALVGPLLAEVVAARKFAGEMRDFCSPHAVAAGYADRLLEAMDRAKEGQR